MYSRLFACKTWIINLTYLLLISLIFNSCNPKNDRQNNLSKTIITIVEAFEKKDTATINNLINKKLKLIILYRQGVFNQYEKVNNIDFANPVYGNFPVPDDAANYQLMFDELPTFDCDKMKWSKTGLFCDTLHIDNLLSTTAIHIKEFANNGIPTKETDSFKELEKNSVRVVLTDGNNKELIFYLTVIDNKWYFSILDRVSGDCSA